jgi:signal transduction histidine kinase
VWGRRGGRVRPPKVHARLERRDVVRAAALALAALLVAGVAAVAARPLAGDDPVEAATSERSDLAHAVAEQLRPGFADLRRQAAALASSAGGSGPSLPAPPATGIARWYWVTDSSGTVTATSAAAGALLGRARPVADRNAVLGQPSRVGRVSRDALLGATVLHVHARTSDRRVLTLAVPSAVLGLDSAPRQVDGTRVAVVGPDRTVADGTSRRPADTSLTEAVKAAGTGAGSRGVRYRGEGGTPRLAGVAGAADGWVVVAEGAVPGDGGRAARTQLLQLTALAGLVLVLVALLLGRAVMRRTARRAEAVQHALLTVTGHELRTPLTIIIGSTRTLTSRWDRLDDTKRKEMASGVGRQARQLDRLLERLLHAGRLAAGQASELSVKPVVVPTVAEALLDDMRRLAPLHDLRVEAPPEVPAAAADERALRQVLEHLLDNAVKYSPDGGRVVVEVGSEGVVSKRVRIAVTDEGVGLPADTSRLFRPFGQSQDVNTRTTDEGGVGVGLSIVKDLVTAMGGTVHAERRPVGSAFVVVLPAA